MTVSTPERAVLELLDELPQHESFDQVDVLMESLSDLAPRRLHKLLVRCRSVKVTRFWLMGLVPVARVSGMDDHRRSAFGRYVAEAVFWTPAALLPGPGVVWEQVNETTARVTVTHEGIQQSVDVTVDAEGRPVTVVFPRWSDANPEKTFKLQPFGGSLSEFRDFDGFRLPTHVEAGNQFGTDAYFPFFIADITGITFPSQLASGR